MGGLTIWKGRTEAGLTKARGEREAAELRIVDLEARRRARLVESDDIAGVDQIDQQIAGERRNITICDQRIAAIEADLRRQAAARREVEKQAALNVLRKDLAGCNALAAEIESLAKQLREKAAELRTRTPLAKWPFRLPRNMGSAHLGDLRWSIVAEIDRGRHVFPDEFRPVLDKHGAGDGVARPLTAASAGQSGIVETVTSATDRLLRNLTEAPVDEPAPSYERVWGPAELEDAATGAAA